VARGGAKPWRPRVGLPRTARGVNTSGLASIRSFASDPPLAVPEPVEQFASGAGDPPIEAERELVQVVVQVLRAHGALVGSEQPSLQRGDHQMDAREQFQGGFLPSCQNSHVVSIPLGLQPPVTLPPISMNHAARLDRVFDEPMQALTGGVRNPPHANSPDPAPIFLCGNDNQCLRLGTPAKHPFLRASRIGFIHLHSPRQPIPSRTNHRPAELVQPCLCRLVTPQAQDPLHPQSAGPYLGAGHRPDRPESQDQRLVGVLEDRPSRHRDLVLARHTLEQKLPDRPSPTPAASRTDEPLRPSQPEEIVSTGLLCPKPSFQLSNGAGIIFHGDQHSLPVGPT